MRKLATKDTEGFDKIMKDVFIEPMLEALREDMNRTAFGQERKQYELPYNKCHEHGLEHNWGKGETVAGGVCWECEGEGLASGEDTSLWHDCWTCAGKGYTFTQYYRTCKRCGFTEVKGR